MVFRVPSVSSTVRVPAVQKPRWLFWQLSVWTTVLTVSDQRQPGSKVNRPRVAPPMLTTSTWVLGGRRFSSASLKDLDSRSLTVTAGISGSSKGSGYEIHPRALSRSGKDGPAGREVPVQNPPDLCVATLSMCSPTQAMSMPAVLLEPLPAGVGHGRGRAVQPRLRRPLHSVGQNPLDLRMVVHRVL